MISLSCALRFCNINATKLLLNSARQNVPLYSPVAGVKTVEEQIGLPPKPKKPLTPYFRYMQKMRRTLSTENPKLNAMELVRRIAKDWEFVDEKIKRKLQDEYQKDRATFVELRAKYDSKVTDEQRSEIKQLKQDIADLKERKAMKKRVRELGRPKKPASAFLKFIIEERAVTPQTEKQTYREWHQQSTAKWSRLTDEEKAVFLKEARKELDVYREEIGKWEEKMVRLGHIDVVRCDTLIDPSDSKVKSKPRSSE